MVVFAYQVYTYHVIWNPFCDQYVYKFLNDMWDYYDISINTYVTDGNTVVDPILCRVVSLEKNRHKIKMA